MIRRLWHGWAAGADADAYERLLLDEVLPGIAARNLPGLRGLEAWRRAEKGGEVEFLTVMSFDDMRAVAAFTGGDPEASVVPERARALLSRFDERSAHYGLIGTAPAVTP
ncbi:MULTISPECIES: antibiotic biosynthesis monooxygenase [unclassified Nocardiopsis]|uniref:antibiotic biosynthesis monooxygenase n=1 Tax=unclassified Nocardiopsis TaxID=2649073 RepID=UPI00135B46B4|nr:MULTISPECIES: antibiotic biosynthesis monooxygenase [unclassified Nocardiopsis]